MYIARGCALSCVASVTPMRVPPAACVTMMPAAVLMISAGICVTRPSPTVRIVYCDSAWPIGRPLLERADEDAADDVDGGDEQAGDGVALHELRRAVHRAVEVGLARDLGAALAGLLLVDQAGAEIGVDRHLLAGHRVQREARGDFGDAAGALRDDDEVDADENQEEHESRRRSCRRSRTRRTTWMTAPA